jgi:hypothetical protein
MSRMSLAGAVLALALSAGAAVAQTTTPAPPSAAGPATYSDAQLQSFAAASLEIDPISRALPSANDEQRTQATTQIREILQRHSIDSATYNAIAAQAQTDSALAARITAFQVAAQPAPMAPPRTP